MPLSGFSIRVLLTCTILTAAAAQPAAPVAPAIPLASAPEPQQIDASAPRYKDHVRFQKMHESFLARAKAAPTGLLFLGDSITERWSEVPEIWTKYYGKYQPANFGINGDMTQHVLWRITNGEIDGISPKVLVLMIGTNNSASHTAAQIAAADRKIVEMIRAKLPSTKILLLALLPRGPYTDQKEVVEDAAKRMQVIRAVNVELAKLDDGKNVRFLDFGPKLLDANGKIPQSLMPDQLHLSAAGYTIWAEAMQPLLEEMMR